MRWWRWVRDAVPFGLGPARAQELHDLARVWARWWE